VQLVVVHRLRLARISRAAATNAAAGIVFAPVLAIDFGDAFLLSLLHGCGIGKRSTPLEYWQVFLVRAKSQNANDTPEKWLQNGYKQNFSAKI